MLEDIKDGAAAAIRLAGGTPLQNTLDIADPGDWLALDEGAREVAWNRPQPLPGPRWEHSAPLPADLTQLGESRLALALCHRDGRIRQEAVRQSVRYPGLLALVVIRCADWVEPVREHARQLLREALNVDSALGLAPLILRVGRRDRGAFGVEVLGQILGQASRRQLSALFADPDRIVRRFAYRLAIEGRLLRPAELARAAALDQDTVVQDLCATAALTALGDEDAYEHVLSPLLSARNPRTAGVTALRRAGRSKQAELFLGDRSALVRACARYVVRQLGGDPAAWYRERCTAPDAPDLPPGAVIGLAECGNRADAGLLQPLLGHPVAGVRARAVAGLQALDRADAKQLWPLLDDPAAEVVRELATALLPSAKELPADWLLERTSSERPRHVRVGAFRLLDARGGIVALRAAVGLLGDPDIKLRTWAGQSVQHWHPSPDQRHGDEVGELLDRSRHLFSDYALRRRKWEAGVGG
ncbi:hypothetical protein ACFRMO_25350 [Streptomyces anulatus]|uniref:hypothetical protein n=1 Tax=Streptomyces anulatus TaxID=1892 RepID=UPI0036989242